MNEEKKTRTITLELDETIYALLEVLTRPKHAVADSVQGVIMELIDHAQQGVYRPGAWERQWLSQAFGDDFTEYLEPGDPYGRPDSPMFQRPKGFKPRPRTNQ